MQRIDKHYGEWLHIWTELTMPAGHTAGYMQMVGGKGSSLVTPTAEAGTMASDVIYVPLQFWFCRNPGLALPLIALQSTYIHEAAVRESMPLLVAA